MNFRTLIFSAVAALGMAGSALAQQWVNPNYCAGPPCQTGCTVVPLQPSCAQPVVYAQPVYYVQPVVVQQPVYYVQPAPVYYAPPPVYCPPPRYNYYAPRYYGGGCGSWGSGWSISIGGSWGGGHHGRWSGGFNYRGRFR